MSKTDLPNELSVRAWMSAPEHVIDPDATVDDALKVMRRAAVRHLLVMSDDELVGIVTDRDLRRPNWKNGDVMSIAAMYQVGERLRVRNVMTKHVISVKPRDSTADAARLMVENKFNCLPVMRGGEVVGIITSSDLLAALVHDVDPDYTEVREGEAV
jgi:acetoin utilization protein AcuB